MPTTGFVEHVYCIIKYVIYNILDFIGKKMLVLLYKLRKHMKATFTLILYLFFVPKLLQAQINPVEVADLSVKVPGLETTEFYYGFEEGDELKFSYKDLSKKGIKHIEVIEYPSNVKYSGYEVKEVSKSIRVNKKGIYIFRFTNSALAQRLGSIKISRVPAKESTLHFNPNIAWKEITDTTYTVSKKKELVGHDTTYKVVTIKELVKTETVVEELFSKKEQIAAQMTMGKPSESLLTITLPQNYNSGLETRELVAWAYWIGVGQEGHLAFEANKANYMKALGGVANAMGNPLIGLALNQFAFLPTGNAGSNVAYYFFQDPQNAQMFWHNHDKGGWRFFEQGNGVSGYGRREVPQQGTIYLGLHNDNIYNDINVDVKFVAVLLKKTYENKQYKQPIVTPRYEEKTYKQPNVSIKRVPAHS